MFDGVSVSSRLTKAVAFAEGCIDRHEQYNKLSLPFRLNNPCDLKITSSQYPHHMHQSGKLIFSDIGIGWNAGEHQMELMFTNKSLIYKNTMTIQEVANHYAKEHSTPLQQIAADNWAKNVALFLGVTPMTTLLELLSQPNPNKEETVNTNFKTTIVKNPAPLATTSSFAQKLKEAKGE